MTRHRRRRSRSNSWLPPEEEAGYDGDAILSVDGRTISVVVHLAGHLEPLDGQFHWYGRMDRSLPLAEAKDAGAKSGELTIGTGVPATVRLAEYDPWGHVQVKGTGAPPYPRESVQVEIG